MENPGFCQYDHDKAKWALAVTVYLSGIPASPQHLVQFQ